LRDLLPEKSLRLLFRTIISLIWSLRLKEEHFFR
jgi:hypothetical protein